FAKVILEASSPTSCAITDEPSTAESSTAESSTSSTPTANSSATPQETLCSTSIITIPVENFSLATFCVMLRYIYTGEIDLSADTALHAISTTESTLVLQNITSRSREFVRWNPLDMDSPWKFKDVTWEELLLASHAYGVTDLQACCEEAVISAMNASNAVKRLFDLGSHFEAVQESALAFIVNNMDAMLDSSKGPFAPYKNHPDFYEYAIELMRRKTARCVDISFTMATLAVKETLEVVLNVVSSFLTDDPANNTASAQISYDDYTFWDVRLSRQGDTLTVHVGLKDEGQDHPGFSTLLLDSNPPPVSYHDNLGGYWAARLVPHKNPRLSKILSLDTEKMICGGTIEVSKVLLNGQFCFDIVLTTGNELSRKLTHVPKRVEMTSKIYDVMQVLLKDIYSVD
ncbi:hypothetical protein BGZ58_005027, partial [Dissophora ornata]